MASDDELKACDHCGKAITKGPWFKRFCGGQCRGDYHKSRRDRALQLLDEQEGTVDAR